MTYNYPKDFSQIGSGGGSRWNVLNKSADYTMLAGDFPQPIVVMDSSAAKRTVTLPDSTGLTDGDEVVVRREGAYEVSVSPGGSDAIDGAATPLSLPWDRAETHLVLDATNATWRVADGVHKGTHPTGYRFPVDRKGTLTQCLRAYWPLSGVSVEQPDIISGINLQAGDSAPRWNPSGPITGMGAAEMTASAIGECYEAVGPDPNDYCPSGTTQWRIAGWFYLDALATWQTLIGRHNGTSNSFYLRVNSSGDVQFVAHYTSSSYKIATLTAAASATTWHHVCIYYDGTNMGVSLDGGSWATNTLSTLYAASSAVKLQLGAMQSNSASNNLDGRLFGWGLWVDDGSVAGWSGLPDATELADLATKQVMVRS